MYNFLVFEVWPEYDFGSIMTGSKRWCAVCDQKFPYMDSMGLIRMTDIGWVYGSSKEEVVSRMRQSIEEAVARCKKRFCNSIELYSMEIKDEE